MDLCLWAKNHDVATAEVAEALDLTIAQVERVYRDIESKRRVAAYLHHSPVLIESIEGVDD